MKAGLKKGDVEFDMYTDLYTLHRDYGIPEQDNEYWMALTGKAAEIRAKYEHTAVGSLVNRHLIELLKLLDNKAKEENRV